MENYFFLQVSFTSDDVGRHLLAVEDLLQKHALMESQVHSMGETIKRLNKQGEAFISTGHKDAPVLQKRLQDLNKGHEALLKKAAERRARLEEARDLFQFEVDMEEEEAWVIEKQRICQAGVTAKDIRAVLSLQQKHKVQGLAPSFSTKGESSYVYLGQVRFAIITSN